MGFTNLPMGIHRTCSQPGLIALTFDDGITPNSKHILEILEREQVKASFFIVGEMLLERNRLPILKQIHEQGHFIGNHTWTHLNLTQLSEQRLEEEVLTTQNAIDLEAGSKQKRYLRPPFGVIDQRVYDKLASLGYVIVLWNMDLKDWNTHRSKQHILTYYQKLMAKADPTKESFILILHERNVTLTLLPDIIRIAREKNFRFVTIDTCAID